MHVSLKPVPSQIGNRVSEKDFGPFRLDDTRYPCGLNMPRHEHGAAHLSCLVWGSFDEGIGSKQYVRKPGAVMFRRAGAEHSVQFHAAPVQILRVQFDPRWLSRVESMSTARPQCTAACTALTTSLVHRLMHELEGHEPHSTLAIEGIVLELLAEALRAGELPAPCEPAWLREIRDRLHGDFRSQQSLADLAAEAGVHPSHVARAFRKRYGCTIGDYLRRLRLEFAIDRLRSSDQPLSQIAQEAGYADQGHFTRAIRRSTGLTPGQFRRTTAR